MIYVYYIKYFNIAIVYIWNIFFYKLICHSVCIPFKDILKHHKHLLRKYFYSSVS